MKQVVHFPGGFTAVSEDLMELCYGDIYIIEAVGTFAGGQFRVVRANTLPDGTREVHVELETAPAS